MDTTLENNKKQCCNVLVHDASLGEWMSSMKLQRQRIKLPKLYEGCDSGTKSRVKALVHDMICPEATDRITSAQVCAGVKIITGMAGFVCKQFLLSNACTATQFCLP